MEMLNGADMLGRRVKIGPGVARSRGQNRPSESGRGSTNNKPLVYDRWSRTDADQHWSYAEKGRRLYVGNLPSWNCHPPTVNKEIKVLFKGFNMCASKRHLVTSAHFALSSQAVSKIVPPHGSNLDNGHYVFVDLPSAAEALRASMALDGLVFHDRKLRVSLAKQSSSRKVGERQAWDAKHAPSQHTMGPSVD